MADLIAFAVSYISEVLVINQYLFHLKTFSLGSSGPSAVQTPVKARSVCFPPGGVLREAADPGGPGSGGAGSRRDPEGRRCDRRGLPGGGRPVRVSGVTDSRSAASARRATAEPDAAAGLMSQLLRPVSELFSQKPPDSSELITEQSAVWLRNSVRFEELHEKFLMFLLKRFPRCVTSASEHHSVILLLWAFQEKN